MSGTVFRQHPEKNIFSVQLENEAYSVMELTGPGEIIKCLRDPCCRGFSKGSILSAKYIGNHSAQAKLLDYAQQRCALALEFTDKHTDYYTILYGQLKESLKEMVCRILCLKGRPGHSTPNLSISRFFIRIQNSNSFNFNLLIIYHLA